MSGPVSATRVRGRRGRAALAAGVGVAGLASLAQGLQLSFHVENTTDAMDDASMGAAWLLGSGALLVGAAVLTRSAGSPWLRTALVGLPVVAGVLPALLLPENIVPYGTALVSGCLSASALAWTVVSTARRV